MAHDVVVLSVCDEDIRGYVDEETWEELEERGLVGEAVEDAARHMMKYLDQMEFFGEMCAEGAAGALARDRRARSGTPGLKPGA